MPEVTATTRVADEGEVMRYVNAYIATSNALGDAIIYLKRLESEEFNPNALLSLIVDRRALEDSYARNERNFLAFHQEDIAMHPPSQPDVDAIVELASQVAQLAAMKATGKMVFDVATDVATRFDEIQG